MAISLGILTQHFQTNPYAMEKLSTKPPINHPPAINHEATNSSWTNHAMAIPGTSLHPLKVQPVYLDPGSATGQGRITNSFAESTNLTSARNEDPAVNGLAWRKCCRMLQKFNLTPGIYQSPGSLQSARLPCLMPQGQRNLQCQWLGKVHWISDHTNTCQTNEGFHGFPTMGGPQNHSTCVICLNDKSVKWMISGYIKFRKHPYGSGWFVCVPKSMDRLAPHAWYSDAIWVQIQAATIGLQISYPYNQATSYLCCKSLLAFAAPHLFTRAALEVFAQLCLDPVEMILSKGWAGHPAVYIDKIVSIDKCGIWYWVISFFIRECVIHVYIYIYVIIYHHLYIWRGTEYSFRRRTAQL